MEVAAAGLPIVASNVGGVSEFIHHETTGLLVDLEDINGYVAAIASLADQPNMARKVALASQKLLKKQHSWKEFTEAVNRDIA